MDDWGIAHTVGRAAETRIAARQRGDNLCTGARVPERPGAWLHGFRRTDAPPSLLFSYVLVLL